MKRNFLFINIFLILFFSSNSIYAYSTNKVQSHEAFKTDSAVLAQIMVIDQNEIAAAKVVLRKKVSSPVRNFAGLMITQHSQNYYQAKHIAHMTGIAPNFKAAASLSSEGKQLLGKLKATKDSKDLQQTYINAMVSGHKAALGLLKSKLSSIRNMTVKKFVYNTKNVVIQHLQKAEAVAHQLH